MRFVFGVSPFSSAPLSGRARLASLPGRGGGGGGSYGGGGGGGSLELAMALCGVFGFLPVVFSPLRSPFSRPDSSARLSPTGRRVLFLLSLLSRSPLGPVRRFNFYALLGTPARFPRPGGARFVIDSRGKKEARSARA